MTIFDHPCGLSLIRHFTVPDAQPWTGDGARDEAYRELIRTQVALKPDDAKGYSWFAFSINIYLAQSRKPHQGPDTDNFPKPIVDAFTGILYPDDKLDHVRGVQVEGMRMEDAKQRTEVWIWGMPIK